MTVRNNSRLLDSDRLRKGRGAGAVTPHDTNTLAGGVTSKLYVGGTGNITARMASGDVVLLSSIPAGTQLSDFACVGINATGTTATLIVAIY